ncbi:MAG: S-methyl-5-thioribose-1-phosphate isomerase [Sulfolobales archaeon]|nr:S-methyl-5-thioribose-1-phosphate isomerase [Sulfolobales archaeon]MCX8198593.1 S-methyl-5-thioribose-1-phosphate isomerase [Sulfolobales archaeon]MDW8169667.1 S-methyl-5-thioribose-1-phosphate isomerase [Desulfurococcaceae archaeon]
MDLADEMPLITRAVWWSDGEVCWINTKELPFREVVRCTNDPVELAKAIVGMEIRGAPAIGVAAALGVAAYSKSLADSGVEISEFRDKVLDVIEVLWKTRPTAYNLFWALSKVKKTLLNSYTMDVVRVANEIINEALSILKEDLEANIRMGIHGASLINYGSTILTHCNAGALATAGYGTVGAVVRIAWRQGKITKLITTETRPLLQGARLNVWEYSKEGIPVTLITDNMVGYVMKRNLVDAVFVGADRITREGFVINKVGTYMIALAAKRHGIPFYVVAPTSTIDLSSSINEVVIEERDPDEVRKVMNELLITLPDVPVMNPAFDVTDPDLVTCIVTEKGILSPPFEESLRKVSVAKV